MVTDFDREHMSEILSGMGSWFTADLLRLCAHADKSNLEKIRLGFPQVVAEYEQYLKGEE